MTTTIKLLLFASCREATGTREETIRLDGDLSVGEFRRRLPQMLPPLAGISGSVSIAVNEEYASEDHLLRDGDRVALIPPVSGGAAPPLYRITDENFTAQAHDWVGAPTDGAVVRFEGIVRNNFDGTPTQCLEYESYEPMARKVFESIAEEARGSWPVGQIAIWHRIGRVDIGELSVLISVASPHRAEAFTACRFIIDRIKEIAPIWKKEIGPDGQFWVEGPRSAQAEPH